jgi:hypothetical protein
MALYDPVANLMADYFFEGLNLTVYIWRQQ